MVPLEDCLADTVKGPRWDGVVVTYPFDSIGSISDATHFSAQDLWLQSDDTPDTLTQGAMTDYLAKDCNSQDWKIKNDKSSLKCDEAS